MRPSLRWLRVLLELSRYLDARDVYEWMFYKGYSVFTAYRALREAVRRGWLAKVETGGKVFYISLVAEDCRAFKDFASGVREQHARRSG